MVSAVRVVASGWREGSVVVSTAGQRRSFIEGILTCVMARQNEVGGKKESGRLVNDNLTQKSRKEEVVSRRYSVGRVQLKCDGTR
jgi:hypothetical protein